jgi:hypothetical protein
MIKSMLLAILFCTSAFVAAAQGKAGIPSDSIETAPREKFQVYAGVSYLGQQFVETMASFVNVSVGVIYNNHLEARISYGTIIDDFKKQIIFPTTFSYQQDNFALQVQYAFFESKIRPIAGVELKYGQASWLPQGDIEDVYTDNILTYGAYAGASWAINKSMTFQTDIGYNRIQELELVGLEEDDFNGFRFEIQLKFGIFRFR